MELPDLPACLADCSLALVTILTVGSTGDTCSLDLAVLLTTVGNISGTSLLVLLLGRENSMGICLTMLLPLSLTVGGLGGALLLSLLLVEMGETRTTCSLAASSPRSHRKRGGWGYNSKTKKSHICFNKNYMHFVHFEILDGAVVLNFHSLTSELVSQATP